MNCQELLKLQKEKGIDGLVKSGSWALLVTDPTPPSKIHSFVSSCDASQILEKDSESVNKIINHKAEWNSTGYTRFVND